jgi:phage terminase large subunit
MDEKVFDTIQLSVRQQNKQNRIILIMNPSTKVHWIYKRFFEDNGVEPGSNIIKGDTTYIHTTFKDNIKNLDSSFIKELEAIEVKNPLKYKHIVMGGWLDVAEGVIFTNWKIGEFNNDLEFGFGLDFGYNPDPTALVKVAIDKKNKKIYLDEQIYSTNLKSSEITNKTKEIVGTKEVIADNAENRLIDELRDVGINVSPCTKGAGSVEEGIMLMLDYEFIITPNSTNIIKEFNNYIWSNKKAGVPRDLYNHSQDAIRYYISHKLKNGGPMWVYGS